MQAKTLSGVGALARWKLLLGAAGELLVVAQPVTAQRKYPVDADSDDALACRRAVREEVREVHSNAQEVHVNLDRAMESKPNEAEKVIEGQGRFQRRSEKWLDFSYQCVFYLRTGEISSVEFQLSGGQEEESMPQGVTLYRDPGYRGINETFNQDMSDLRRNLIRDDQATSVRISPGCVARLYQDLNFRGAYTEVTSDIPDLRGSRVGDDSVTSLRVRCDGEGWETGSVDEPDDDWDDDVWSVGVTLYRDPSFRGVSQTFDRDVPDLRESRVGDDQATSVKISRGCRARLYQDLNYRGSYTEVSADIADLRGSRVGDDSVTSLQVRCDR